MSNKQLVRGGGLETNIGWPTTERALGIFTQRGISAIAMAIPLVVLAFEALFWVRDGVDLPFLDDWRDLLNGTAGSFALSDLFRPANDTIYATGKFLDALSVRFIGYNGIIYQLLSMIICLGLLLYMQYRLLFRSQMMAAASLGALTCVFMLQPYSYWGLQSIAYHQALPLMAVLGGLVLTLSTRLPNLALAILLGVISVLGGLAYISGAFVDLTTALVLLVSSTRGTPEAARRLRFAALGFVVGAVVTLPVQLWVILISQGGQIHSESIPWTFPWQPEFWVFLVGLVGRSVGAQTFPSIIAISLTLFVAASLAATAVACLLRLRRTKQTLNELQISTIYLTLFCGIGAYAVLVAASRASHGAAAGAPLYDWFLRSGQRFHYFWLTLLLPWAVAVGYTALRDRFPFWKSHVVSVALSFAIVAYAVQAGMFSYSPFYKNWSNWRMGVIDCIQEKILAQQPIVCGGYWSLDLTEGVQNARLLDVSFTRYLLFRDEIRSDEAMLLGSSHELDLPGIISVNGAKTTQGVGSAEVTSNSVDPQLVFQFRGESVRQLRKCRMLHVKGKIRSPEKDVLQIFVTTPHGPKFSAEQSTSLTYEGGEQQSFNLFIGSRDGFLPDVRMDPGTRDQTYQISELEYLCR